MTDVADRCPTCGASVRVGDPWCTLCYTDLRPPAPPPAPSPDVVPDPAALPAPLAPSAYSPPPNQGPDPLTAPLEAVTSPGAGPSWPCAACGTVNPMAQDTCTACGRHFLAGLREDQAPLLELPVVGDITQLSRGTRLAIAFGAVLVFLVITLVVGMLFS